MQWHVAGHIYRAFPVLSISLFIYLYVLPVPRKQLKIRCLWTVFLVYQATELYLFVSSSDELSVSRSKMELACRCKQLPTEAETAESDFAAAQTHGHAHPQGSEKVPASQRYRAYEVTSSSVKMPVSPNISMSSYPRSMTCSSCYYSRGFAVCLRLFKVEKDQRVTSGLCPSRQRKAAAALQIPTTIMCKLEKLTMSQKLLSVCLDQSSCALK